MHTPLTTIEVDGREFKVGVRESGDFVTTFDHEEVKAESLKELTNALRKVVKKANANLSIPFTTIDGKQIKRGTITGVHGRTGNYLVTWADGSKTQLEKYADLLKLTDAEAEEYLALHLQRNTIADKIREIQRRAKINVSAELAKVVGE